MLVPSEKADTKMGAGESCEGIHSGIFHCPSCGLYPGAQFKWYKRIKGEAYFQAPVLFP